MIEAIRQYFIDHFDQLAPSGTVGVDYLKEVVDSYSIEPGIGDPWVKRYVDGGGVRQYNFTFTSREAYGPDTVQNMDNLKFYAYISERIETLNLKGTVPQVMGAYKVEVLTNGYIMDVSPDTAKYQIQLRLLYAVL